MNLKNSWISILLKIPFDYVDMINMQANKYNIDDIVIGDLIYFDSVNNQSNYDDYWEVTGKSKIDVFVRYLKFGHDETWAVPIADVRHIDPTSQVRQNK